MTGTTVSLGDHLHGGVYEPAGTAAAAVSAHEGDASDAHDASAISILDTADDFTATDVEGALAELQADAEAHAAAGDPHTGYATDTDLSTHAGAVDPHTGYQKESEKSAASGYASLDGSVKVPIAELPTGTTGTTVALGNHGHSDAAPPGLISPFGSSTPPTGWLLCDGTSYATATYAALFAVIGYTFGGAGANFNVPDLKGRVVVGYDAAEASFDAVGETGGAKTHTHAGHSDHAALTNNHTGTAVADPAGEAAHTHSGSGSTGAGTSHSHPGSGVTGWHGGHQHYNNGIGTGGPSSVSVADFGAQWNPANSDHTHQVWGWTDSGGGHDHGASSAGGEASHTHPASAVGAGSSHTHTQGAVTQPTAHGAISAHSAHDTPSHLPPYLAIPYIIKT